MYEFKKHIFKRKLLFWFRKNGRCFPWRYQYDPYKVYISEVLLQQTNVEKVIPIYNQIVEKYPTVTDLSYASSDFLKSSFKDLGLFYRAERMKMAARLIDNELSGFFPSSVKELKEIKSIGEYSANAIMCFGFGERHPILDTNVIRIYFRFFGIESSKKRPRTDKKLWRFAEELLPKKRFLDFNYALLDFGALICKYHNPVCSRCTLKRGCHFYKNIYKKIK